MRLSERIAPNTKEPSLGDNSSLIHAEQEHDDDTFDVSRDGWQQVTQRRPQDVVCIFSIIVGDLCFSHVWHRL